MNISNYSELVSLISGLEIVLSSPSNRVVFFEETNDRMGGWKKRTMTAGKFRELLENACYEIRWPGWILVFPGEQDELGMFYQGIYAGPCFNPRYRVSIR